MSKLPKPNVVVALNEEKAHQMTPAHIRGIICNPIYAGIPPFPQTIPDEQWIAAAQKAIQEDGLPQFLVNMLHVLRETYRNCLEENQDDVCDECGASPPQPHPTPTPFLAIGTRKPARAIRGITPGNDSRAT